MGVLCKKNGIAVYEETKDTILRGVKCNVERCNSVTVNVDSGSHVTNVVENSGLALPTIFTVHVSTKL